MPQLMGSINPRQALAAIAAKVDYFISEDKDFTAQDQTTERVSENYKPLTQRREVAKDSLEKLAKRRQNRLVNQDLMDFYQNLSVFVSLRLCVKEFSDTF